MKELKSRFYVVLVYFTIILLKDDKVGIALAKSLRVKSKTKGKMTSYSMCFSDKRLGTEVEKASLTQFTGHVDNSIKAFGREKCTGSDCRDWMESKILAFCKANLLSQKLDKHTFNLVQVLYKTEAKSEYSHFLFSTETGRNLKVGSSEFNSKLLFRICVPVDRKDNAYVDFKCPYEKCTSYEASKSCKQIIQAQSDAVFTAYKKINEADLALA